MKMYLLLTNNHNASIAHTTSYYLHTLSVYHVKTWTINGLGHERIVLLVTSPHSLVPNNLTGSQKIIRCVGTIGIARAFERPIV